MQSALRCPCIQKLVEPLVEFVRKFSRSGTSWTGFKKVQLEMLHREGECNNDKGDTDFDGDEELSCNAEGRPQIKKVLRLLTQALTRWNSMYS